MSRTKLTIHDDGISVSEHDGNITDMLNTELYTREWKLIGTEPPGADINDYFDMKFVQRINSFSNTDTDRTDANVGSPILFRHADDVLFEQIPIDRRVLGYAYEYFSKHVSRGIKGDLLLNVCKGMYKSPVFDIPGCTVVIPKHNSFSKESFVAIETPRGPGVLFVPMVTTDLIIDNLEDIGIRVMPSHQDMWSYSSCRIRLSKFVVVCQLGTEDWRGSAYAAEFSRRLACTAVATATLTVSVLLEPWQYSHGKHTSKHCMTYVIHAVK